MERFFNIAGSCVVADSDLAKPWDGKVSSETVRLDGRTIHVFTC